MKLLEALYYCWDKDNYKIPKNTKGINHHSLLSFIASKQSSQKGALGYTSSGGWSNFIKRCFPDKPKHTNYYEWLLNKHLLSYCVSCDSVKHIDDFSNNSNKINNKVGYCKKCFYANYKHLQRHINAKYRAAKLKRTVAWGQKGIKEFYENCPKGYEVDHVIPLQGETISGLHVLNNLQYLTKTCNAAKGNRL